MSGSSQGTVTEYVVKVPKAYKRKYNMMRFHAALGVDFKSWTHTKMERENNLKEFKSQEEEMPKFGAGSEFGREQREEARRKKYGINVKKYKPEDQPWILSIAGKNGKKFKGIREGGVSENSSWYVFMQGKDGAFEAYPVEEWYNFKLIQRYKYLNAEEAEKEFERRDKIMNYFSVMYQKKLKKDGDEVPDGDEEVTKKKGSAGKSLLLSELDDWMSDGDESEGEEEREEDSDDMAKGKKKNKVQAKGRSQHGGKKKKTFDGESDEDCLEESDEFDDGAEHDYISSDSSDSDAENDEIVRKELAGVDQEDALKKLLDSDEEDEEEKDKEKEKENEEKQETEEKEEKDKKKKKKKKKDKKSEANKEESEAKSSDTSDDEPSNKKKKRDRNSDSHKSKSDDGSSGKRKLKANPTESVAKKQRTDMGAGGSSTLAASPGSDSGVTEESIRRYLMRKPMTTTELLHKFKCKKTGLNSDQLVHAIAQILKRINPTKQMVKGKMYLSIKQ
ncbi:general transcription factor IIF subunit 1 isoform X1 [Procambarus clarkii]|uniref:general transcription factor IIF subunit 1 isoform X1 n=1 Tax=Procambarus clarkii TaxID=6728 RepID=UPI003743B5FF